MVSLRQTISLPTTDPAAFPRRSTFLTLLTEIGTRWCGILVPSLCCRDYDQSWPRGRAPGPRVGGARQFPGRNVGLLSLVHKRMHDEGQKKTYLIVQPPATLICRGRFLALIAPSDTGLPGRLLSSAENFDVLDVGFRQACCQEGFYFQQRTLTFSMPASGELVARKAFIFSREL